MSEKVSIIVPIYNAERYLKKCLLSLQNQIYKNIEVLLIDDGSKDNSSAICKEFSSKDARFRYYYQENLGVSAARNLGLKMAEGSYVGFCDSDDWEEPKMISDLMGIVSKFNADIAIVSAIKHKPDGPYSLHDTRVEMVMSPEEALRQMHETTYFEGQLWNKLIKRSLLEGASFRTDITIFEDILFLWTIFPRAKIIAFKDLKDYHYIVNNESALHLQFSNRDMDRIKACEIMQSYAQSKFPNLEKYVKRTYLMACVNVGKKMILVKRNKDAEYKQLIEIAKTLYTKDVSSILPKDRNQLIGTFIYANWLFIINTKLSNLKKASLRR